MDCNEIIENPLDALGLHSDQVLVNVIIMGEFVDLAEDAETPNRRRLAMISSDELEPWTSIGMLEFAKMREHDAVTDFEN